MSRYYFFLLVEISPYTRVQDHVLTHIYLSVFGYSYLKVLKCLYAASRLGKNELVLVFGACFWY